MTLHDQLAPVPREERQRIKAEAVSALPRLASRTISRGRWRVTITADPVAVQRKGTWCAELAVRIDRDGKDVTPADLNPIRLVNPPVLVPDPAGEVVIEQRVTDRFTGIETTTATRYREDPAGALLLVLRDLILGN